eukprot:gene7289-biopygen648
MVLGSRSVLAVAKTPVLCLLIIRSSVRSQRILGIARAYTTYYGDELSKEPKEGLESNNFDKRIRDMEENDNQIGQAQQPQPVSIQLPPVKEFDPKGDPSTVKKQERT